jgi:hypothetical protein
LAYVCWLYECGLAIARAAVGFKAGAYVVVTLVSGERDCQCRVANRRRKQTHRRGAQSLLVGLQFGWPGVVGYLQNVEVLAKRGSVRASHLPLSNLYQRGWQLEMLLRDHDCAERQSDVN